MSEELTAHQKQQKAFFDNWYNDQNQYDLDWIEYYKEEYAKAKTEELQKEVESLKGLDRTPLNDGMLKANCKLKAENEKLKEGIKGIIEAQHLGYCFNTEAELKSLLKPKDQ
jgi:hypothetical protein